MRAAWPPFINEPLKQKPLKRYPVEMTPENIALASMLVHYGSPAAFHKEKLAARKQREPKACSECGETLPTLSHKMHPACKAALYKEFQRDSHAWAALHGVFLRLTDWQANRAKYRPTRLCEDCKTDITTRDRRAKRCVPCAEENERTRYTRNRGR